MNSILAIGIFNSLLFVFLLTGKNNKQRSDRILTFWMVLFALNLLSALFTLKLHFPVKTVSAVLTSILFITHFPFLYIYTRSLTGGCLKCGWEQCFHFIPVILLTAVSIPFFRLDSFRQMQMANSAHTIPLYFIVSELIVAITFVFYMLKTILLLRKNEQRIRETSSYEEKVNLAWVKNLIVGFICLLLLTIITFILSDLKVFTIIVGDEVLYAGLTVIVLYVGFWGYRQGKIFYYTEPILFETGTEHHSEKNGREITDSEKPGSELSETVVRLQHLMKEQKPYLDPELTIVTLAARLDIHPHKLSKVINARLQRNFFDFINQYRVEELKYLAQHERYRQFSILAIAFEAGFNSKASFNRIFKNLTGDTPSGFIRKQK